MDMLVKLYELPDFTEVREKMKKQSITIRRPIGPEKSHILNWVQTHFGTGWRDECDKAFSNNPISIFIAIMDEKLIGFAAYDATVLNFFGPTGVLEEKRGLGAGKALLLYSLEAMRANGYAYAVIGSAGPMEFYAKSVGAQSIEGSKPGIYGGMLQ